MHLRPNSPKSVCRNKLCVQNDALGRHHCRGRELHCPATLSCPCQSQSEFSCVCQFLSVSVSLCLSLSICLSSLISISAPVCLYVCVFVCLLGCRSVGPSFRLCPSLSVAQRLPPVSGGLCLSVPVVLSCLRNATCLQK